MTSQPPSISTCIEITANLTGFRFEDLVSRRQHRELVRARHIAMWVARQVTNKSFPQIGAIMRRDHTSVMYGVNNIEWRRIEGEKPIIKLCDDAVHRVLADPRQEEMAV